LARGLAAFAVTIFHGIHGIALEQYVGHAPFQWFFSFAHAGVDFFFVLSGFIIYIAHHADVGDLSALPRYVWRRVTRIYPIYWVITGFVIILIIFRPGGEHELDAEHILNSVLLLPQSRPPLIGVAWTLEHEMLFYLAFSSLIIGRRLGAIVFIGWTCLIVAVTIVRPSNELLLFAGSRRDVDADTTVRLERADRYFVILEAVLIALYELHLSAADSTRSLAPPRKDAPPATAEEYEKLFADTERALYAVEFFKTRFHEHIMRTVRTLFYRAAPDSRELALLRAIFIEVIRTIDRITRGKAGGLQR